MKLQTRYLPQNRVLRFEQEYPASRPNPLTLKGSDYAQIGSGPNKAIDRAKGFCNEAVVWPVRLNLEKYPCNMSQQFFYIQLKFTPKIRTDATPSPHTREVVIEVPKHLVQSSGSGSAQEKAVAIVLARRAAVSTFPTVAERLVGLYDEDPPTWFEERPQVMNERPCDHEENGTRAWRIA
jgi:hypothetical protein